MLDKPYVNREEYKELAEKVNDFMLETATVQSTLLANNEFQNKIFEFLKENFKKLEVTIGEIKQDGKNDYIKLEDNVKEVEKRVDVLENTELLRKGEKTNRDAAVKNRLDKLTKWGGFMGIIVGLLSIVQTLHLTKAWSSLTDLFTK